MAVLSIIIGISAKKELYISLEDNALNLLNATKNQVESHYNSINYYKAAMIARRKIEMKNNIDIAFTEIEIAYRSYEERAISEEQAKRQTLETIRQMRYDGGVGYFWMNDTTAPFPKIIMHPVKPSLVGRITDDPSFNCLLDEVGQRKKGNIFTTFLNVCLESSEGYVDYLWPKPSPSGLTEYQPKIGFVKLFKPWDWIIGTGVYVDDINNDIEERTAAVIGDLNKIILKQKIGKNGYFFIFNKDNHILVHPNYAGTDGDKLINPTTKNVIFEDFKTALSQPSRSFKYLWDKADDKGNFIYPKIGYITYFEPLGWYIATTIYVEDYENKIAELNKKMVLSSGFFILLSLAIAFLIAKSITKPLHVLIESISNTDEDGLPTSAIPIAGVGEIENLSLTINKMLVSIKKSRSELKQSESFNKLLFKDSRTPLIVMDSETNKFIDCNQAAADIYNFKNIDETIGKTPLDVSAKQQDNGDDSATAAQYYMSKAKKEGSVIFDWKHQRPNGELWDAEVQLMLFHYDNKDLFQFSLLDITERKKALEELNHARRMEAIGQLAGGVAHDFNNMLSGIMTATQLLQNPKRGLDKKGLEFTDIVMNASSQAAELTKKLLAFGRKEAINSDIINVHEVINDTVTILQKTIDRKISILTLLEAKNSIIKGNASGLQNVLINLSINASHAMPEGGELFFKTKNVEFDKNYCDESSFAIRSGQYIEIEVRDIGCGIEPANIKKIFEPYFTTRKQGEGSGLGLASVYGTVMEHFGSITVASEIDLGTTFYIYLPLSATKSIDGERSANTREDVTRKHRGAKILLIDDEEIIRAGVACLLDDMGYEVITAVDGMDGIDIFREKNEEIDLIIVDMIMPNMNGSETFYKLREIDSSCKVLLASGFTDDENIEKLRQSGLNGFISKPFRDEELSKLMDVVLAQD
ncbi:MAG: cache domain-containing protein [Desulfobacterales bacterium]|nr:cache domain-containing protein [Desulfobacterales bacterium]